MADFYLGAPPPAALMGNPAGSDSIHIPRAEKFSSSLAAGEGVGGEETAAKAVAAATLPLPFGGP